MNPAPWRDDDEHRRMAVEQPPASDIAAALRSNFPVTPLPSEMRTMLDKLR